MKKDKERIKAVHDDNLIPLLKNLGFYDDLIAGRIKCKFCKGIVTIDNLSALIPDSGNVGLACDKPNCQAKLNSFLNER